MPKKAILLFTFLALAACFLSYKLGSVPVAMAKARPALQDDERVPPPLPAPPAEWVVFKTAVGNVLATAVKPGVAGVQHVVDCVTFTGYVSSGSQTTFVDLIDGSTGIMQWSFLLTTQSSQVSLCGLNVVGSVGNSMTLEFTNANVNSEESVNLIGHDAT